MKILVILLYTLVYNNIVSARRKPKPAQVKPKTDPLYDYVRQTLKNVETYRLPTNNEKLFKVKNETVLDYGKYDFIIVGAGAAGCVLANRLSEIDSWSVLLLEAGGVPNSFSDIPIFPGYLQNSEMNWGYYTAPQKYACQGMNNTQCTFPTGKVLGGTTTISAGIYSRGSAHDYNSWSDMDLPGWSFEEVLPYFKKSEHVVFNPYDKDFHGAGGELYVNKTAPYSAVGEVFVQANLEKGLKNVDYNAEKQIGVSGIQFNLKGNIQQNAAHAFLQSAKSRKNLKIVYNAAVNKILLDKFNATGVTFVNNGTLYRVSANKEVILSAGAINTPQLLMLSGIGPERELKKFSIPVVTNLRSVGKHLKDQPMFVNFYVRTDLTVPGKTLQQHLETYKEGKAPMTNGAALEHLAFINARTILHGEADIEYVVAPPPFSIPADIKQSLNLVDKIAKIYKNYNTLTDSKITMLLTKPKSQGQVTLRSKKITDFPIVDPNFYSDVQRSDLNTMIRGIKYFLSLLKTKAFKSVKAKLISTNPNCEHLKTKERQYWTCALKDMTTTGYSPCCTTRMGPFSLTSVVNNECIVHHFDNLRVVDAGVFPDIPRGKIAATVYMVAEKISDHIKYKYGKK
ncbi:glucose dehydrogenase [FAD, quinone]-like [Diabrotica virgifera virgifera]|uniref:Glucose dehydrogenase [FAD, quinone]-like n=1 Tax=Diabrotica virgifera virgifera TaxID=50390 RepID=A0A6P7FUN9_DIAVI|nr:glucose dehydrogenase [FAD, quinone]-like [Diabrotica virgifera virgifera]